MHFLLIFRIYFILFILIILFNYFQFIIYFNLAFFLATWMTINRKRIVLKCLNTLLRLWLLNLIIKFFISFRLNALLKNNIRFYTFYIITQQRDVLFSWLHIFQNVWRVIWCFRIRWAFYAWKLTAFFQFTILDIL